MDITQISSTVENQIRDQKEHFLSHFQLRQFGVCFAAYTLLTILSRALIPEPRGVAKLKNPRKQRELYYGEIVSFVHANVSLVLVTYCWVQYGFLFNEKGNWYHYLAVTHSIAYFIVDQIASQIFKYADSMSRPHHFISIFSCSVAFMFPYGTPQSICNLCFSLNFELVGIIVAQVSNPILQLRNTMRRDGRDDSQFYDILEKVFVVIFLIVRQVKQLSLKLIEQFINQVITNILIPSIRLILPIPISWLVYSCKNCPMIIVLMCSSIFSISMIWNIQIINKLWKAVKSYLTNNGKLQLSKFWITVEKFGVKGLLHNKIVQSGVALYVIVFYYLLPIYFYRL